MFVQNSTYLPVLDYPAQESDFFLGLGLNIPSFIPHQVVRIGLKATDVLDGPFSSYKGSFSSPRGFPGSTTRNVSGQALANIDYIASIALLDQPLFLGIPATGVALGVHAEGIGRWDDAQPALSVDPSLYVGGELTIRMACNAHRRGAAVRLRPREADDRAPRLHGAQWGSAW